VIKIIQKSAKVGIKGISSMKLHRELGIGQKVYHPMILFKVQLISVRYGLSDVKTEDLTYDEYTKTF